MRKGLLLVCLLLPAIAAAQTLEASLAASGSPAAGFALAAALGLALRLNRARAR